MSSAPAQPPTELYICPYCERPLASERIILYGKRKPPKAFRVLECGHRIPVDKRPVLKLRPR